MRKLRKIGCPHIYIREGGEREFDISSVYIRDLGFVNNISTLTPIFRWGQNWGQRWRSKLVIGECIETKHAQTRQREVFSLHHVKEMNNGACF